MTYIDGTVVYVYGQESTSVQTFDVCTTHPVGKVPTMSTSFKDLVMKMFAKKLRAARKAAGYSSAEKFAHALGAEPHTYRHYERGEASPSLDNLTRICQLLDVTPNDLLPLGAQGSKGGRPRGQTPTTSQAA